MNTIKIIVYSTSTGKEPFVIWRKKLNKVVRAIINVRLDRMRFGNFGDAKMIKGGGGLWELRIPQGPGYRIYFGKKGKTVVILLTGGDKGSQKRDIVKAKEYWLDYKESQ